MKLQKLVLATALACGAAYLPAANASVIQLGFILDRSGSIGSGNWSTIVNGLANAVGTHIPVGGTDTYQVSVVTFASSATVNIDDFLVTDATARSNLASLIAALPYTGGGTNFQAAFASMITAWTDSIGSAGASYINFATDGVGTSGVTERNTLISMGVDNISIEGIGSGVNATTLQNDYCYPGPCDTTSPYNFPTQGFYIGVADAQGYANAIGNKVQTVTGGGQVPEPATLGLLGLGLMGLAAVRRRKTA